MTLLYSYFFRYPFIFFELRYLWMLSLLFYSREPFYQSQLLPALMICPLDDRLSSVRQQLIQALNSRGKVDYFHHWGYVQFQLYVSQDRYVV